MLRGVSFANHSPDGSETPKQALQEPSCGRLALKPAIPRLASDHAAVQFLALPLRQPRTSAVVVELKDAVGKVILLFLPWCLGLSSSVSLLLPSTSRLDGTAGVDGEDVAKHALGRGEVHLWGAGRFGIEAAKGWGVGEGGVEARQGRGRCARFVNERHKWLWSSEHLEKWKIKKKRISLKRCKKNKQQIYTYINIRIYFYDAYQPYENIILGKGSEKTILL